MSRPLIGAIANFYDTAPGKALAHNRLNVGYSDSVIRAGGLPVILPLIDDTAAIDQFLDTVDGVLFGGGYDIDPARYGQPLHEKTQVLPPRLESYIFRVFERVDRRADLPALGICLGCQLFNVARGGTLHQHIPDAGLGDPLPHFAEATQYAGGRERHTVRVQPGTVLARVVANVECGGFDAALGSVAANHQAKAGSRPSHTMNMVVNSGHHQAVDRIGDGLIASAASPDGIVEAVEDPTRPLFLAVQWHPEDLVDDPNHAALFAALVNAAGQR